MRRNVSAGDGQLAKQRNLKLLVHSRNQLTFNNATKGTKIDGCSSRMDMVGKKKLSKNEVSSTWFFKSSFGTSQNEALC